VTTSAAWSDSGRPVPGRLWYRRATMCSQPLQGIWNASRLCRADPREPSPAGSTCARRDDAHTGAGAQRRCKHALGRSIAYTTAADVAKQEATNTQRLQQLLLACDFWPCSSAASASPTICSSPSRPPHQGNRRPEGLGMKSYQVIPLFLLEAVLLVCRQRAGHPPAVSG